MGYRAGEAARPGQELDRSGGLNEGRRVRQTRGTATHRRTLPRLRRARRVAWLGLILLLLNALSPTLADAMSNAPRPSNGLSAASASLDDLLQGRLVICTPTGLRVIQMTDDGAAAAVDPSEEARDSFCPFCPPLSSAASAGLPVLATLLVLPEEPPADVPETADVGCLQPPQVACRVCAPRGPPSVV